MTYASEVLADSPLLYWRLGDASGTTATDSSGNGRHGTYVGSPTLGVTGLLTGDSDTAVQFDGVDDEISFADTTNLSAYTIETWIKTSAATGFPIIARRFVNNPNRIFSLQLASGAVRSTSYGTSGSVTLNGPSVADGLRHHVALTWGSGTATLYVDGASVTSGALAAAPTTADVPFTVGNLFPGVIDEVAYYGTALSSGRIAAHYAAGTSAPSANEVTLDADLPAIVGAFDLDTSRVLAFDADLPSVTGALTLDTEAAPASVTLDATMPPVVGGLTLDNLEVTAVRVEGVLPSITGGLTFASPIDSEVNRAGAVDTDDLSEMRVNPPVATPTVAILPMQQVAAQSYPAPSVVGTQVLVEPTYTREPAHRDRILIAGRDVTYFRGVPTPTPDWQLIQPLLWGAATIELPQVAVPFEQPGYGALSWLKPGAPVFVQRVDTETGAVVATDYRGFIIALDISGGRLVAECGGHASGRAVLMDRQMRLVQIRTDAGTLTAEAMRHLRLRHDPPLKTETGIDLITWGGGDQLTYINELIAKMATVDGDQWTLMPDENAVYRTTLKDLETIHGTVYLDDARCKADLRRDIAEEPNRIFASGVTPEGMVVKFGAYPGLIQAPAPDYPMDDNSPFGIGTTDADTDTGDGVTVMAWRLLTAGYINGATYLAGYGSAMAAGIKDLQRDADLNVTGTMNRNSWRALFDLSVTGYDLRNIEILPAAQRASVKKWRRSANGGIIGKNPAYDPSIIWVDRTIAMGAGFTRAQIRQWSRLSLVNVPVWRGTIELNLGAIVAGDHTPGAPVTELLRDRDIQPGMNLSLPLFAGGIDVHVAGVSFTNGGKTATLAVSTQPGDTLPVWAAIQRDRDNRNTVHRSFFAQRRSADLERGNTYDEVGGVIRPIKLDADNWTVFPVVAKQAGTIEKIRMRLSPEREFVIAVFGRKISPRRLRRVTNAPLTLAGRKRWTEEAVYDKLNRDHVVLYVAGSDEDPCGYFPRRKSDDDAPLTGRWEDDAGFPFVTYVNQTDRGSVLWVAVWVGNDSTLQGGRIMWPSAEEY